MIRKNRIRVLGLALATVSLVAAVSYVPVYSAATTMRYRVPTGVFDSLGAGQLGGDVWYYRANDSLRLGDVVYLIDTNKVAKSATLAAYNTITGVVCGGTRVNMNCNIAIDTTHSLVATANQRVSVMSRGRYLVRCDSTTGGLAIGISVIPSLVAGKVKARTTAIDTNGRVFARLITACAVNTDAVAQINVK